MYEDNLVVEGTYHTYPVSITSFLVAESPMNFAEVLTELLVWSGSDRIICSTGPTAVHPQALIEAFRELELPDMLLGLPRI